MTDEPSILKEDELMLWADKNLVRKGKPDYIALTGALTRGDITPTQAGTIYQVWFWRRHEE